MKGKHLFYKLSRKKKFSPGAGDFKTDGTSQETRKHLRWRVFHD